MKLALLCLLVGCGRLGYAELGSTAADDAPDATTSTPPGHQRLATQRAKALDSPSPDSFTKSAALLSLDAGDANACAVRGDGTVVCWGINDGGVLGVPPAALGSSPTPVMVPGVVDAIEVGISIDGYACALHTTGEVSCWGRNLNLLADSTCCSTFIPPTRVPYLRDAVDLAVSEYNICVVKSDGTVWCWGADNGGQGMLGARVGDVPNLWTDGIQQVASFGTDAVEIAGGFGTTCAVKTDGTAWCFGANDGYQLASEVVASSAVPLQIPLTDVTHVDVGSGSAYACATRSDRSMWCWGDGARGALGNGAMLYTGTPVQVSGLVADPPATFSAGTEQTCARAEDKTLDCWGYNGSFSPLGIAATGHQSTPQPVLGLASRIDEVAAGWAMICARSTSEVWCWGSAAQPLPMLVAIP